MLDDPHGRHFAPPGVQRHLADQLAFDRVSGPEDAVILALALTDLRRRVRRQDDLAESMVPNIDPEQVRKLAGGGRPRTAEPASPAGVSSLRLWAESLISRGFASLLPLKASGD